MSTQTTHAFGALHSHDTRRRDVIVYWISTGIVCAVMSVSAILFFFVGREGFAHLGLPNWFRMELTAAKLLGVGALLLPGVPTKVRELAYAGFGITIVSAMTAHMASGDGVLRGLEPSIFLCALIVSYVFFQRIGARERPHPPAPSPSAGEGE